MQTRKSSWERGGKPRLPCPEGQKGSRRRDVCRHGRVHGRQCLSNLKFLSQLLPGEGYKFLKEQCILAKARGFADPVRSFDSMRRDVAREAGYQSCSTGIGLQSIDDFLHLFSNKREICHARQGMSWVTNLFLALQSSQSLGGGIKKA
jgi:hypothetical protein